MLVSSLPAATDADWSATTAPPVVVIFSIAPAVTALLTLENLTLNVSSGSTLAVGVIVNSYYGNK